MSTKDFFDLSIGAPARLARMRRAFDEHAAKYPRCPEHMKPKSWRDVRRATFGSIRAYGCYGLHQGFNSKLPIWYTHGGAQFRDERFADEVTRSIDHNGWFADVHCDNTIRGIVGRLPHGRFIAGYHESVNGERVYYHEVFDDERDAALMADEHAQVVAEVMREDSERYEAAQELQSDLEGSMDRLRECLALRNKPCFAHLREEALTLIEKIRESRETLRTDYAAYI